MEVSRQHTFCFFLRHASHATWTSVRCLFAVRCKGVFDAEGSDVYGLTTPSPGMPLMPLAPGLASSDDRGGAG